MSQIIWIYLMLSLMQKDSRFLWLFLSNKFPFKWLKLENMPHKQNKNLSLNLKFIVYKSFSLYIYLYLKFYFYFFKPCDFLTEKNWKKLSKYLFKKRIINK